MIKNSYFNTLLKKIHTMEACPPQSQTAADADLPTKHHTHLLIKCLSILFYLLNM